MMANACSADEIRGLIGAAVDCERQRVRYVEDRSSMQSIDFNM